MEWLNEQLHLRMPGAVERMIEKNIGPCTDRTLDRVTDVSMLQSYDGAVALRRLVSAVGSVPVMRGVMAAFLMREFVAQTAPARA